MRTGSSSGQGSIWCGFGADGSLQVRVSDAIMVVQLHGGHLRLWQSLPSFTVEPLWPYNSFGCCCLTGLLAAPAGESSG